MHHHDMKDVNTESYQTLLIRRTVDWAGHTGVELSCPAYSHVVFAYSVKQAVTDLEEVLKLREGNDITEMFKSANKTYYIFPAMTATEKDELDDTLIKWVQKINAELI